MRTSAPSTSLERLVNLAEERGYGEISLAEEAEMEALFDQLSRRLSLLAAPGADPQRTVLKADIDARVVTDIITFARRHGWTDAHEPSALEWLEQRISLLEEHEAILKEAELEAHPDFSSPQQPERSAFAAKLRAGQALSASQAMILMAAKLQQAQAKNVRLRAELQFQTRQTQKALIELKYGENALRCQQEGPASLPEEP